MVLNLLKPHTTNRNQEAGVGVAATIARIQVADVVVLLRTGSRLLSPYMVRVGVPISGAATATVLA